MKEISRGDKDMHMNQFGRQWAVGHIGVVANCLRGTSFQNLNVGHPALNCKISPFSVIFNTSPHFSSFKFSFKFILFAIIKKKLLEVKKKMIK